MYFFHFTLYVRPFDRYIVYNIVYTLNRRCRRDNITQVTFKVLQGLRYATAAVIYVYRVIQQPCSPLFFSFNNECIQILINDILTCIPKIPFEKYPAVVIRKLFFSTVHYINKKDCFFFENVEVFKLRF